MPDDAVPIPGEPTSPDPEPTAAQLFAAILYRDADEARAILRARPELAHARDDDGQPVILVARYRYETDILEALLAAAGPLTLVEAVVAGDAARVGELAAADPEALTTYAPDGFLPLHLAAYLSQPEVTAALLEAGADPAAWSRGEESLQPLHLAALRPRNAAVVRALAAHGAPLDEPQDGGLTPLHRAAGAGDRDNVLALLAAGARRDLRDDGGRTPAELAFAMEHDELAALLTPPDG